MPLLRRTARAKRINLEPWMWRWARSEPIAPLEDGVNPFSQFGPGTDAKARAIWDAARDTVIAEWATEHSGGMPPVWWLMDAPGLWNAKRLGNVPVEFRFFESRDTLPHCLGHDISAKAQRPFLEKMGVSR